MAAIAATTTQIDNHRIRASSRSKRSSRKRNRTEIENSAYGDGNVDGETKSDQSFAQHGVTWEKFELFNTCCIYVR